MSNKKIGIEYEKTELLIPYPENPREFSCKGKSDLKKSIKKFGWTSPLLINMAPGREYITLSGNMRLECAKELGIKEVPVVKLYIDDPEKELELLLRMNVLNGDWSEKLLRDLDITVVLEAGVKENEISAIWDNFLSVEDDDFDPDKAIEEIGEPKTKLGDLYELGMHRLICSDSTDPKTVIRLMDGAKANMLNFDSPYNINFSYDKTLSGKSKYHGQVEDNKTDQEYREFLTSILKNGLLVAEKDCHVFHFCDEKYIWLIQEIFRGLGIKNERVNVWVKNNFNVVPQCAFNKAIEACPYGIIGRPFLNDSVKNLSEIMNREIGTGNRTIDDLLDLLNIWIAKRLPTNQYLHPTTKPPSLYEKLLRRCSKPGDVILDLYGGSGSLMVACENLKRKNYISELSPVFCDVIINRYERATNKKAKLISGGQNGKN